jgi:hypothetical protein
MFVGPGWRELDASLESVDVHAAATATNMTRTITRRRPAGECLMAARTALLATVRNVSALGASRPPWRGPLDPPPGRLGGPRMFASSGSSRTRRSGRHARSREASAREGTRRELVAGRHPDVRGVRAQAREASASLKVSPGQRRSDSLRAEAALDSRYEAETPPPRTYPQTASRPGVASGDSPPVNGNGSGCAYVSVK